MNEETKCHKCNSNAWDWANIGFTDAKQCTDCGYVYMEGKKTMTESEFETRFDRGEFDCEYAAWISEKYDAWSKHQMLKLWEDPDVYVAFMETKVTEPSTMLQDTYFEGKHPLEAFPSIFKG